MNDDHPPIHPSRVLPWQLFTKSFEGHDLKVDQNVRRIMEHNEEKTIDFRPYCNDNPMTVVTTDSMLKCCE